MANNKNIKTIVLSNYFDESISSRASVVNLFKSNFNKVDQVHIDFADIDFISRSVAHQFLKEKKRLRKEYKISMLFQNENASLDQLFATVLRSNKNNSSTLVEAKSLEFSSTSDLTKFLLTV